MMIFIMIIHVIACLMLIAVILLQAGRGHGLAGSSFGGEMQTVLGTKTASFMSKMTTGCAVVFLITCLTIDVMSSWKSKSLMETGAGSGLTEEQVQDLMKNLQEMQAQAGNEAADGEAAAVAEVESAINEAKTADISEVSDKVAEVTESVQDINSEVAEVVEQVNALNESAAS